MSDLFTLAEVAAIMKLSPDTVARKFAKLPGVVDVGTAETRNKRRYRVIRIPKSVLEKYLSTKAGHPVTVTLPDKVAAIERRGDADYLARAIADKEHTERAIRNAKTLYFIPRDEWDDVVFLDEEEER